MPSSWGEPGGPFKKRFTTHEPRVGQRGMQDEAEAVEIAVRRDRPAAEHVRAGPTILPRKKSSSPRSIARRRCAEPTPG
jgi:hypothetical protein